MVVLVVVVAVVVVGATMRRKSSPFSFVESAIAGASRAGWLHTTMQGGVLGLQL